MKMKMKNSNLKNFSKVKKEKKNYPGFKLGNSDPIANHITTRTRVIEKN